VTLRLRQICLVAPRLEPAVSTLCNVLGIAVCYRDPHVGKYGLENAVMPVGNTFLEVVAPVRADTSAGRYLDRRHGAGGYMAILDCDAIDPWIRHLASVGVRIVNDMHYPNEYRGVQLHPRDTGGTLLEINWTPGGGLDGPYHPAGPDWHGAKGNAAAAAIVVAEIQADDPLALGKRWSAILARPLVDVRGVPTIELDLGTLRFVPVSDGHGEGLGGIDIRVTNRERILAAAAERGVAGAHGELAICGVRIRLVD
jgi:Glyoxalase-like domain